MGGDWPMLVTFSRTKGVSLNEDVSCAELFRLGDKDILLCIVIEWAAAITWGVEGRAVLSDIMRK